jgi:hypothetical protein
MNRESYLFIFSLVIVLVVLLNLFIVLLHISFFKEDITGMATGYVNLSIMTQINIALYNDSIEWGSGAIDLGESNATLYTRGDNQAGVLRGNWSNNSVYGMTIANIGNINCSIFIKTSKNASSFFQSASNTNQEYKLNVSNKEGGACNGGVVLGDWRNVNVSDTGTKYCSQFSYLTNNDEVFLDVLFTVPSDSQVTGYQSDQIVIMGDVAG